MTPEEAIARARADYSCETIAIDDDARITESEDGTWVQAWVLVLEDDK